MGDYIVSARKYRPASFDSVVGQRALTTTLQNAIRSGKLAHAYLFCGPRGVGKTTCARIFAKTINCLNLGANGEACNECESCRAFNEQRSYNIHELDAASNNSVDDIRSLIEQVRVPPQIGKYKVFIIDEVHMLSPAAFNAFLKTLEEPPHHAIFILATTEKHKILPTILSRCQIYDFNRMGVNETVEHLKYVAEKEGIPVEPEALNVIAQKADGGMRDALSIFDQVVSFTGGQVTYQRVIENLNVLDYEYYFRVTDYLLENKVSDVLLLLNEILNKGFDGHHFITGLASHLRDLLVSRDEATLPLLEVSDSVRHRYCEQAKKCDVKFLYRAIKVCNGCDINYRESKNKRLLVEISLIQMAQLTDDAEPVSGRSPKKTLKPLFKQQAAQTSAPVSAATTQVPQANAPAASVPQQGQNPQMNHAPQAAPAQTAGGGFPFANKVQAAPKVPTFKSGVLSVSIRNVQQAEADTQASQQSAPHSVPSSPVSPSSPPQQTRPQPVEEDFIFNENDIRHYWLDFANQLPIEESATAGRMKDMHPRLINDTTFEVAANNELVERELQQMRPKILAFIRQQLHNSKIEMQTKVEEVEVKRAYGRVEQFQQMKEKNPNLQTLKEIFGLELG